MSTARGWFKSTRSGGSDNCVEARHENDRGTSIRHSKNREGFKLKFDGAAFSGLVAAIQAGAFPADGNWATASPGHSASAIARLTADGGTALSRADAEPHQAIIYSETEWAAFCEGVRSGEFSGRLAHRERAATP